MPTIEIPRGGDILNVSSSATLTGGDLLNVRSSATSGWGFTKYLDGATSGWGFTSETRHNEWGFIKYPR